MQGQSADVIQAGVEGASLEYEGSGASQFAYATAVREAQSQQNGGQGLQSVDDLI